MPTPPIVRVGVGVFILQTPISTSPENPRFLIGLRKGSHGANTWGLPGGHLEFGETFEECAKREVKEETGLDVTGIKFVTATNDVMPEDGKHYVTVFMACTCDGEQDAQVLEPEKCERWDWMEWEYMLESMKSWAETEGKSGDQFFLPLANLVAQREDESLKFMLALGTN